MNNESTIRLEAVRAAAWYCLQKEISRRARGLLARMLTGFVAGILCGLAAIYAGAL